jgi:hypothetical protein
MYNLNQPKILLNMKYVYLMINHYLEIYQQILYNLCTKKKKHIKINTKKHYIHTACVLQLLYNKLENVINHFYSRIIMTTTTKKN